MCTARFYPGGMDFRFVMPALPSRSATQLSAVVQSRTGTDVDVSIGGSVVQLDDAGRAAVLELLTQLATGRAVAIGTVDELLTTSQAAEVLGVSDTYVRRLADAGDLPIEMRGTHRRFRLEDLLRQRDRFR
ncbi:putative excisionase [Rhodococcus sp. AW25M09]|nr:putative excisionase [Rhodococcus sp. AW25M09]